MLTPLKSFVTTAWSQEKSKRSCLLILITQIVALFTLLCIGFVYVHVNLPNYNAKRLSKSPLMCSTVVNQGVEGSACELPWNKSVISFTGRTDNQPEGNGKSHRHKLFEEDAHSVTVSVEKIKDTRARSSG